MSVATELEALSTNLAAAKDAVTAKGGTVGDTGLAGLASEIASISGGGGTPAVLTGKIAEIDYYTDMEEVFTTAVPRAVEGCTLDSADWDKFAEWVEAEGLSDRGQVQFYYYSPRNYWAYYDAMRMERQIPITDMASTTGLNITMTSDNQATVSVYKTQMPTASSGTATVNIIGEEQWQKLGGSSSIGRTISGLGDDGNTSVNSQAIKGFWLYAVNDEVGKITYFPDLFLSYCLNLSELGAFQESMWGGGLSRGDVGWFTATQVEEFGEGFLRGDINLAPNTGAGYMYMAFNNAEKIGPSFMQNAALTGDRKLTLQLNGRVAIDANFCHHLDVDELKIEMLKNNFIGGNFCSNCTMTRLSAASLFTSIEDIPDGFVSSCPNLTDVSPLSFPKAKMIAASFFAGNSSFNSKLEFPMVEVIEQDFLYGCTLYNQDLDFPQLKNLNLSFFLNGVNAFTSTINFGSSSLSLSDGMPETCLSTTDVSAALYTTGAKIAGFGRGVLLALGDLDGTPGYYRKLLDAGGNTPVINGTADPTTSTEGLLGQLYVNITTCNTFQCVAISDGVYTWTKRWVVEG